MSKVETNSAETAAPAAPAAPAIQITDLQNAVQIIDYACEQGAFKGWKVIEQVIAVREKLAAFLAAATPAPAPAPAEETAKKPAAKKAATKKAATKKSS
jgi:hypothetical protein